MCVPSGEISSCSTHECGMSKHLSSSSLPCGERWAWGGLVPVRSYGQSLCLDPHQGQARVACELSREPEVTSSSDLAWNGPRHTWLLLRPLLPALLVRPLWPAGGTCAP